jgi:release factor glutamine methyltransferase
VEATLQAALHAATERLSQQGCDSPRLTAEVLLAHALQTTRMRLFVEATRRLNATEAAAFEGLLARRLAGEPTHYLVGEREFYGRTFRIDPRALIPRPETELLVTACLRALPGDGAGRRALDLCSGSGCIGLTLLAERTGLHVTAVDRSEAACDLARENAALLRVAPRFEQLCGDLYAPLGDRYRWDLIAANPPYVRTGDIRELPREIRDHEPREALDGGSDGLSVLRRILDSGLERLAPGATLAIEIADGQGPAVTELMRAAGLAGARIAKDYSGLDRIATGQRPPAPKAA